MWFILQLLAVMGVALVHTFNRWAGIHNLSFLYIWPINIFGQACIAPLFIYSYKLAPSFLQPWFLGTLLINVLGFCVSLLFFKESIYMHHIIAIGLAMIATVLLVK